ncbi:MAG TPA: AMP-binding protein, partial [Acidimicrobiales bacterium]|nr:AMP-binding protein [Acidimicrobiales bacterium]
MESYVPADTSSPVLDTTIATILADAAATCPGTDALVAGVPPIGESRRRTYGELFTEAASVAGALAARFEPGERLSMYAPSLPEAAVLSFAAAMASLILVPFNPVLRPAEAEHILAASGAAGVFVVDSYRDNRPRDVVGSIRPALPSLREVLRFEDWNGLLRSGPPAPSRAGPAPDDIAQIIFTSGTTGTPKGARLTHRGMTNAARFGGERFGLRPGDVYINTIPLFHVGGQEVAFAICQAMAANVLVPTFEPGLALSLIEAERATHAVAVPTMLVAMIEHPSFGERDLSSLRAVSSGGAVVPPEVVRHIEATLGVQMTVVFGQTETCGYISQTELDDPPELK